MNAIRAMLKRIGLDLIDDADKFTKFWSVRIDAINALIVGALAAYNEFPPGLQQLIDPTYLKYASGILLAASMTARALKQTKLTNGGVQ